MEIVNTHVAKREDKQLLVVTHLSQYLDYVTGFGGLIVPLLIWFTTKDKVHAMDEHGKAVINFQLSLLAYICIGIPCILLLGLGFLIIGFAAVLGLIMPAVNAIKANNGEAPSYFGTFKFLS
ncbi:hypothetical protein CLV91_1533 [Maribacter vaceletii]|uniref:tRNA modification GTPase n=1 Tax=Maribacter vaceletii TaxID=1206816 RepID=A0A495E7A2_9FLAO|nr:DUF4870 domain-containing protein [Maribacter vaceletii]RKR12825.1 hypothetical protein CLV91_1533 [Maribacter vaceletii]